MSPNPKATGPRLVIIEGTDKGKIITLENGTAVVGRSKGDVLIHDSRISRSHVAIHFDDKTGKVTYTDLKSLNGTLINGKAQEAGLLQDGDKLQIGNTVLDCQIAAVNEFEKNDVTEPAHMVSRKVRGSQPKEPKIAPEDNTHSGFLAPVSEGNEAGADGGQLQEPEDWEERKESLEVTQVFFLKKVYLKVPRKTRVYALCFAALSFLLVYEFMTPSGSVPNANREVTSIRKLQSEGKVDEAIQVAEQVKKIDPKNIEIYLVLGDLYAQQGKGEYAAQAYNQALKIDPSRGTVYTKVARLCLLQGKLEDAELANREIDRLLVEGNQNKDFFVEVANLYLDFRELQIPPQKMVIIGEALQNKYAPGEVVGMKLEALGLILQNFSEQALGILEHAHRLFPQDQSIYQYMVVAKLKLKDAAGATSVVEEWTKNFPEELRPLLVMAQIKYEAKQTNDALALLQKMVQQSSKNPNDAAIPEGLNLLGRIYQQMNQPQEAATALKQSCDLGFTPSCEAAQGANSAAPQPEANAPAAPSPSPVNPQPTAPIPAATNSAPAPQPSAPSTP